MIGHLCKPQTLLTDTAEAVTRVVAEKSAGRNGDGTVDLIWINGANLASMKAQGLLYGPFTQALPNFTLVDTRGKPSTVVDFTLPVEGMASPWLMAQIIYVYDSARAKPADLPRSILAMLEWSKRNPGRLTHPTLSNFLGATFLKQALYELAPDPAVLSPPGAELLFEVFSQRYERSSTIVTSNLPFEDWTSRAGIRAAHRRAVGPPHPRRQHANQTATAIA